MKCSNQNARISLPTRPVHRCKGTEKFSRKGTPCFPVTLCEFTTSHDLWWQWPSPFLNGVIGRITPLVTVVGIFRKLHQDPSPSSNENVFWGCLEVIHLGKRPPFIFSCFVHWKWFQFPHTHSVQLNCSVLACLKLNSSVRNASKRKGKPLISAKVPTLKVMPHHEWGQSSWRHLVVMEKEPLGKRATSMGTRKWFVLIFSQTRAVIRDKAVPVTNWFTGNSMRAVPKCEGLVNFARQSAAWK